ncbi:MAG: DUF3144 domain-containing protein [Agarilytica sp.]
MSIEEESFWNAVDDFIESANQKSEDMTPSGAASAMMQATARYTAFYLAGSAESRKDLKEDKDDLIQDVSREFKRIFAENLEDYIENYKVYLKQDEVES